MRRLTTILTATAMLVGALAVPALATDDAGEARDIAFTEASESTLTLGELLVEEGPGGFDRHGRDYDIIRNIVLAILGDDTVTTNLGAALDPDAELTLFIPNDRAFQRLVYQLADVWLPEADIIGAVLGAGFSLQDVNDIVENHVFVGVIPASAALEADGVTLTAVGGGEVTVDVYRSGSAIRLIDDARPYTRIVDTDNYGTNGVFHGINQVILSSAPTPMTLGELLVEEGPGGFDRHGRDYDIIRNIVLAILGDDTVTTNLGAALDPDAELTLFIPNDRAFQRLVYQLADVWLPEADIIGAVLGAGFSLQDVNDIVENHVFVGVIPASAALEADGVTLTAVGGGEVTVDVYRSGSAIRLIDDARPYTRIVDTDNYGTNGVFHGINQVILSS